MSCVAGMVEDLAEINVPASPALDSVLRFMRGLAMPSRLRVLSLAGAADELTPLEDESADVVISTGLVTTPWERWTLQEIHRVLRPGGHAVVILPNRIAFEWSMHPAMRLARRVERMANVVASAPFDRRCYSPSEMRQLLESLDFDVLDCVTRGFDSLPLLRRSSRLSHAAGRTLDWLQARSIASRLNGRGRECVALARKPAGEDGVRIGSLRIDAAELNRRFEGTCAAKLARRTEWLAAHPDLASPECLPLDVGAPAGRRVLVVSPHPDDETVGCGGTLARLIDAGAVVTVLHTCDGSSTAALAEASEEDRRTVRPHEARAVAEYMRFAECVLWNEPDAAFECSDRLVDAMAALIARARPDWIFVPFVNDPHANHFTANRILAHALSRSSPPNHVRILGYEVWGLVPPNRYCRVDEVWDRKRRALLKYHVAMKPFDYVHDGELRHAWHARQLLNQSGLAEVFCELDARRYVELVESAAPSSL